MEARFVVHVHGMPVLTKHYYNDLETFKVAHYISTLFIL